MVPRTPSQLVEPIARGLGVSGDPVRHGDGWSNNVWLYDEVVIRIAVHPGPGGLAREAALALRLPGAVGYPKIIGSGVVDGHDWMAQVRLPGDNLAASWDSLAGGQRAYAIRDLWSRLEAVPGADVTGLALLPTPLYAFETDLIRRQLEVARRIVGDRAADGAIEVARAGLDATRRMPTGLVHTDAVLTNVVWTGSAAIPIDFEFGCVGPIDLDADCVGRDVITKDDPVAIAGLGEALGPTLGRPGAIDRMRGYSVLRNLWAIGKWADHDPQLTDADTWDPVQSLLADSTRSGWADELLGTVRTVG